MNALKLYYIERSAIVYVVKRLDEKKNDLFINNINTV